VVVRPLFSLVRFFLVLCSLRGRGVFDKLEALLRGRGGFWQLILNMSKLMLTEDLPCMLPSLIVIGWFSRLTRFLNTSPFDVSIVIV